MTNWGSQMLSGFGASLRAQIVLIIFLSVIVGALTGGSWYKWNASWEKHLTSAYESGVSLFEVIEDYQNNPNGASQNHSNGFELSLVDPLRATATDNTVNLNFPDLDGRTFETRFSILDFRDADVFEGVRIPIRIFSRKLAYSLGAIPGGENTGISSKLGSLVRTLTVYCGDTLMFVNIDDERWLKVDGNEVWGCENAPNDWRLLIFIIAGVSVGTFLTIGMSAVDRLDNLSKEIRARAKMGRIAPIQTDGPREVLAISSAVNHYFEREKDRLEQRASLLSGISHDLGTPATRLKLRAALIEDPELRSKLETTSIRSLQ